MAWLGGRQGLAFLEVDWRGPCGYRITSWRRALALNILSWSSPGTSTHTLRGKGGLWTASVTQQTYTQGTKGCHRQE